MRKDCGISDPCWIVVYMYYTWYGGPISLLQFQYYLEIDLIWFLFVAIRPILEHCRNHVHFLAILPIASGLPKIQNPAAIVRITNIEVPIAGGLR